MPAGFSSGSCPSTTGAAVQFDARRLGGLPARGCAWDTPPVTWATATAAAPAPTTATTRLRLNATPSLRATGTARRYGPAPRAVLPIRVLPGTSGPGRLPPPRGDRGR